MSITWGDIKLAVLQKMFASNGTTINSDSSTTEYINAMPQAANEALQMLATAGKFIVKSINITLRPVENLIPEGEAKANYQIVKSSKSFIADAAHSYYFKAQGTMTCKIYVGSELVSTIEISNTSYTAYKGLISNDSDNAVTITFTSVYPSNVKNVALYGASFALATDVIPYEEYIRYYLPELATDFYQLQPGDIYYEGDGEPRYIVSDDYYQESEKTLVLKRDMPGDYTVYYRAYPQQITLSTADSEVLSLDPEVAAIMPLYMASQLYKDDDNSISTVYRNEFEVAFQRLAQSVLVPKHEEFVSESGWC